MKRSCIRRLSFAIAIGMLVFGSATAQVEVGETLLSITKNKEERPRTKLEAMMRKTGTVVSITSSLIGKVKVEHSRYSTMSVYCIEVTDVFTGVREIGIIIGGGSND